MKLWLKWVIVMLTLDVISTKVLELSDKFVPLRHEGMWLVKFYAPWCGHCKKLEPIFKLVSQALGRERDLRVGRIDCTRFPSVANEFGVRGYPTILFIKGAKSYTYDGDRTRDDIVAFAQRLVGPPVQEITAERDLDNVINNRETNFAFIGEKSGELWKHFEDVAEKYQQFDFFIQISSTLAQKKTGVSENGVIRVFKENTSFKFQGQKLEKGKISEMSTQTGDPEELGLSVYNDSLVEWVKRERFPSFVKVTHGKFYRLLSAKKLIVMAVLEENKIGDITPEMEDFRNMLKLVHSRNIDRFREIFQFGWTGEPSLANSVAMDTLALPNLIVINSTSLQHYLPDDDPLQLTADAIQIFLDGVLDGTAPVYGGSSYSVRLYRAYYELKSSFFDMWKGNPVLTAVLFGLPLGFFSLICYSICCADIMDAEEDDEEEESLLHEKTD